MHACALGGVDQIFLPSPLILALHNIILRNKYKGRGTCAICWISSVVSAEFRLKNILEILSNCCPLNSKASIVFSKVGTPLLCAIASISAFAFLMLSIKAGLKCFVFICEKGAVWF